jgi:hypothetical protein
MTLAELKDVDEAIFDIYELHVTIDGLLLVAEDLNFGFDDLEFGAEELKQTEDLMKEAADVVRRWKDHKSQDFTWEQLEQIHFGLKYYRRLLLDRFKEHCFGKPTS